MADRGLTGVLLVGGDSTRFGSPKALARLEGKTLAEIAWATLAFCDELDLPSSVVDDGTGLRAPIAGLGAGRRTAANDVCVVLPVDLPRIRGEDLVSLADACRDAAVPQTGPLPGAYRHSALPVLERRLAAGELTLRSALDELDVQVGRLSPESLANVNTPHDLDRI